MSKDTYSEDLTIELKNLADSLEDAIVNSTDKSKDELNILHNKVCKVLDDLRIRLNKSGDNIVTTAREATKKTENYIRENPWYSIGVTAVVGIVLGIIIARR